MDINTTDTGEGSFRREWRRGGQRRYRTERVEAIGINIGGPPTVNLDALRDLVTTLLPYVAPTPPTIPRFTKPTVPKRRRKRARCGNSRQSLRITIDHPRTVTATHTGVSPPPAKRARYDHWPCDICGTTTAELHTHIEEAHLPWNFRPQTACWLCELPLRKCLRAHMASHFPQERRQAEFAPHFYSWANSMIAVLEAVRKLLKQQTFEGMVDVFCQREWYPRNGYSNAALGIMLGEVARIMGRPISPGAIQVSPPNHPVAVLNWYSLTLMLTGQPAPKREAFRHRVVSGQPPMEIPELIALDAHCHLRQLEHREAAGQGRGVGQSMFRTDPVRAWEETFLGWRGSNDIQLLAVIDNRVFPQEWQRPHMRGVTVGHRTIVVKTTYGAHPRLAKTFTDNA